MIVVIPHDMPKLESPFVREMVNDEYVVTPKINQDLAWVFEDENVIATEKLHGTNVSVVIVEGCVISVWNRTQRIPFINKGKGHIIEGVLESCQRGYLDLPDGQWFGELIGPKVNGNPYQLDRHVWVPFKTYVAEHLRYKSWGKYAKDYATISDWFKILQPLYCWKIHGKDAADKDAKYAFVEGIVFHHPDGRMAKLRKDMFDWFTGKRHKGIEDA